MLTSPIANADYRHNPYTGKLDYYKKYVFVGSGVNCVEDNDVTTCTINAAGGGGGHTVIDDSSVAVIDDGGNTVIDDS